MLIKADLIMRHRTSPQIAKELLKSITLVCIDCRCSMNRKSVFGGAAVPLTFRDFLLKAKGAADAPNLEPSPLAKGYAAGY